MGLFKNIKDRLSEDAGKTGKTLNSVESEQSGEPSASDRDWPIIEHLAYYFMAYAYYADGNIDNMEMKKQLMEMKKIMATQGMLSGRSKTDANPNTNRKQRTKRLSKVMMARRNSTVKMVDPTEDEDENEDDMDLGGNDWAQMTDETTGDRKSVV